MSNYIERRLLMEIDYFKENMEKWRLEYLLMLTNAFEEVFSDAVNKKRIIEENYETILANVCGKTLVTSREIIILCANGYPDGALSLARNIFEQMVIIAFFEQRKNNPDFEKIVEKYFNNYTIQRNKILIDIYKLQKDSNKERECRKKLKKFKVDNNTSDVSDYWWSGYGTFSKLCKEVIKIETNNDKLMHSLLCRLYSNYKRACLSIHANCMGNAIRLGKDSYIGLVDTSPTTKGQEHPLFFLTLMLTYLVCTACKEYEINYTEFQKNLTELSSYYLKYVNKSAD